jgi:hypothetical protein
MDIGLSRPPNTRSVLRTKKPTAWAVQVGNKKSAFAQSSHPVFERCRPPRPRGSERDAQFDALRNAQLWEFSEKNPNLPQKIAPYM